MISVKRPSNTADIAYLFYLPFCMVFTSSDKLHEKTAPLFMRPDQAYVSGIALKADLKRLDAYFSAQPREILDRGLMYFDPPMEGDYLTTRLWMRFLPGWRAHGGKRSDVAVDKAKSKAIVADVNRAIDAPEATTPFDPNDAAFMVVQRLIPARMGKWRILPDDVVLRYKENERRRRDAQEARTSESGDCSQQ